MKHSYIFILLLKINAACSVHLYEGALLLNAVKTATDQGKKVVLVNTAPNRHTRTGYNPSRYLSGAIRTFLPEINQEYQSFKRSNKNFQRPYCQVNIKRGDTTFTTITTDFSITESDTQETINQKSTDLLQTLTNEFPNHDFYFTQFHSDNNKKGILWNNTLEVIDHFFQDSANHFNYMPYDKGEIHYPETSFSTALLSERDGLDTFTEAQSKRPGSQSDDTREHIFVVPVTLEGGLHELDLSHHIPHAKEVHLNDSQGINTAKKVISIGDYRSLDVTFEDKSHATLIIAYVAKNEKVLNGHLNNTYPLDEKEEASIDSAPPVETTLADIYAKVRVNNPNTKMHILFDNSEGSPWRFNKENLFHIQNKAKLSVVQIYGDHTPGGSWNDSDILASKGNPENELVKKITCVQPKALGLHNGAVFREPSFITGINTPDTSPDKSIETGDKQAEAEIQHEIKAWYKRNNTRVLAGAGVAAIIGITAFLVLKKFKKSTNNN